MQPTHLSDASCGEYFIQPRILDALFIVNAICLSNVRFYCISIQSYVVWSTHSIGLFPREYCGAAVGPLLDEITSHVSVLNGIFHSQDHLCNALIFAWKRSLSPSLFVSE